MARTLNPETHAVKRDAFIDVAQRLILAKGYEGFSVQEVIDETGASKGAFYHYFGAKSDLLEAIVERMADAVEATWDGIMSRPDLSAMARFEEVFHSTAQYKSARRDLTLAILEGWLSDGNVALREKLRDLVARRMTPVVERIVRQGVADGDFTATDPEATAQVIVALVQGIQEVATRLWLARQAGTATVDDVLRTFAGFSEAVDRILGLEPGRMVLGDPAVIREWFG